MNQVLGLDRGAVMRLGILSFLFLGTPLALVLGVDATDLLQLLRRHLPKVSAFVEAAPAFAAIVFMTLYGASVAVSLPATGVLIMVAGFLFGWFDGTIYVVAAATMASTTLFLITRRAFAQGDDSLAEPRTGFAKFARGFKEQSLTYVFVMHLVAVVPYAMLIAVPAAFRVRTSVYVVGSVLGILPSTILLAHLGAGVGHVLLDEPFRLSNFLTSQIIVGLGGFALLALSPLIWRALAARRRVRGLPSATPY